MQPQPALVKLLLSLFSADELLRFVRWGPYGSEVIAEIPANGSPASLVDAVIAQLDRRGLIDDDFFRRLLAERPRREGEILAVRQGVTSPAADKAPANRPFVAPGAIDVLVAVALPVEFNAVVSLLDGPEEELTLRDGTLVSRYGLQGVSGRLKVGVVQTGPGNENAAVVVAAVLRDLTPRVVVFVGVAGGVNSDVKLGDVVMAAKVYGYEYGKGVADGFRTRPEVATAPYRYLQRARTECARPAAWLQRAGYTGSAEEAPLAHIRAVAAGNKVVGEGSEVARLIAEHYSDAYAVEMEGLGLHKAAEQLRTDAFVVRGISDMLVKTDKADRAWQPKAARNAAAFALEVLSKVES